MSVITEQSPSEIAFSVDQAMEATNLGRTKFYELINSGTIGEALAGALIGAVSMGGMAGTASGMCGQVQVVSNHLIRRGYKVLR